MKIRNRLVSGLAVAALAAAAMLGSSSSASADASGCTLAPGGNGSFQCMNIYGGGLHIDTVYENYDLGADAGNVCQYQAAWQGDFQASGWTIYYSNFVSGCAWYRAYLGPYTVGDGWMWDNSYFYGYFLADRTGGAWSSPVRETIHN